MLDKILKRIETRTWKKSLVGLLLILIVLWLAKIDRYRFSPDTQFSTISGETFTLKTLQGKPVLITFWATSCGICLKEIPDLVELYQQFHPQGLEIIAIAMAYDPPNRVVAMTRERNLPYPVVLDLASEFVKAFGPIWGTPTSILIDTNGVISKRKIGAFELTDMQSRIQQLLEG
jgi:thiol-disulfide isomerase/thioredoxin